MPLHQLRPVAWALSVVLAAGCVAPPIAAPSAANPSSAASLAPPSSSTGTADPSETPNGPVGTPAPATSGIATDWEAIDLPGIDPMPYAAVSGDAGFVIVGAACDDRADCLIGGSAWYGDGITWKRVRVPAGSRTRLTEVVYNGAYIALGVRTEPVTEESSHRSGILFRSTDGRSWAPLASFDVGGCNEDGCPVVGGLVVTRDGLILLTSVSSSFDAPPEPRWSVDGETWTPIPPTAFGYPEGTALTMTAAIPNGDGVVALITGEDIPLTAWRSDDGATWTKFGAFDGQPNTRATMVDAGGGDLVVARSSCVVVCRTTIWISSGGGSFVATGATFDDFSLGRIVSTGDSGLVMLGFEHNQVQAFTSLDGRTWARPVPGLEEGACGLDWVAGGPGAAMCLGVSDPPWITRAP
jgi:hypothetical protein